MKIGHVNGILLYVTLVVASLAGVASIVQTQTTEQETTTQTDVLGITSDADIPQDWIKVTLDSCPVSLAVPPRIAPYVDPSMGYLGWATTASQPGIGYNSFFNERLTVRQITTGTVDAPQGYLDIYCGNILTIDEIEILNTLDVEDYVGAGETTIAGFPFVTFKAADGRHFQFAEINSTLILIEQKAESQAGLGNTVLETILETVQVN